MSDTPDLNKALVAAQLEMQNPHFDSENPHFRSKFASLKSVIQAVKPVLAKHGIAVIQELVTIDGLVGCVTHLLHESGQSMKLGPFAVQPLKGDPQAYASASTYARRYTLQAAAAVTGDPDDDGNAASESAYKTKQMKTKVWKALRDAAANDDALLARETWDELNTEQQTEIWRELASGQRSTIKTLLEQTKEANNG